MPKIFEYFGIILEFFVNDHEPIHVHATYGREYGMKVELYVKDGKIIRREYKKLKGRKPFAPAQMRELKKLIEKYQYQIKQDWIDVRVNKKKVTNKKIMRRIK